MCPSVVKSPPSQDGISTMVNYNWPFIVCTVKLTICHKLGKGHRHGPCLHGSSSLEEKKVINQLLTSVRRSIKGEEESAMGSVPHRF